MILLWFKTRWLILNLAVGPAELELELELKLIL